ISFGYSQPEERAVLCQPGRDVDRTVCQRGLENCLWRVDVQHCAAVGFTGGDYDRKPGGVTALCTCTTVVGAYLGCHADHASLGRSHRSIDALTTLVRG